MAKELRSASVAAPGFFGLNLQESSVTLAAGFALQADNCIIDKYGRLGSRKGWDYQTTGSDGVNLKGSHEFVDINGVRTVISWNDTTFYTGVTTLTTPTDTSTAFTSANFDAATLNDKAFFCQRGQLIRQYDPTTNTFSDVAGSPKANTCLSAYGRLWVADTDTDKTIVYWSNLLDGTDFATGSSGSIDLSAVLVKGNDEIVALGAHNGRLIIFCKDNIVVYDSQGDILDPVTMSLVEVITDVGCIARDSVQNIGVDILFLSNTGLLSLGRVLQEKSQPMRDLSRNVRDDLINILNQSDVNVVRSSYSIKDAFYLLYFPEYKRLYCFDTRSPLQDGSARVTLWDSQTHSNMFIHNDELYCNNTNGIAKYTGYKDYGQAYVMKYYTNYFDFDDPTSLKILKRITATVIGGNRQAFTLKAGFDYFNRYRSFPAVLEDLANYEWGIAEWGIAEYSTGTLVDQVRAPMGGDGVVVQMGLEADIEGQPLSIQRLDIYVKQGKTL